jgi:hypothetical protein
METQLADSSVTERRRARAAALKGGGPKAQRSRITNGRQLLMTGNGTAWARRCRDLIALYTSDIPEPSAAVASLIRRACVHEVQLEQLEERFALANDAGKAVDAAELDLYVRASGNLRRLLETVGLERRQRDVSSSSLATTLESIAADQEAFERAYAAEDAEVVDAVVSDGKIRLVRPHGDRVADLIEDYFRNGDLDDAQRHCELAEKAMLERRA